MKQISDLIYYPETGVFNRIDVTKKVGSLSKGYLRIRLFNKPEFAHRIAWRLVFGEIPSDKVIDHINGNRLDNRICNLRLVTRSGNSQNQSKPHSRNKTGFLGVHFLKAKNKFRAMITINSKVRFLGYFNTAEEAHSCYVKHKRELHKTCMI